MILSNVLRVWATLGGILSALLLGASPGAAQTADGAEYPMEVRYDTKVEMPDGARLSVDVFRPDDDRPHPTVFSLTPYNNDGRMDEAWEFVRRGYAYAVADSRGRYDSDGEFYPYRHEGPDGSVIMDWISGQPWSNGEVVTLGGSYLGKNQWLMARENNPHHRAIVSYVGGASEFHDGARYNGVPKLDLRYTWMMGMDGRVNQSREGWDWNSIMYGLPLHILDTEAGRDVPAWRDLMQNDAFGDYWRATSMVPEDYERFDIPSFNVTGWYEGQLKGQMQNYVNALRTSAVRGNHVLVVGPWLHGVNRDRVIGERDAGPEAIIDLERLRNAWMDHQMASGPRPDHPNFLYFVPGKNEWRGAGAYPIPATDFTEFYLDSDGGANTLAGDGELQRLPGDGSPDEFTYDPSNPVPTFSSRTSGARGGLAQGSVDNRSIETRQDVLVYTSEPLDEGVEVTGPVRATIYFSTDVQDTDITVKLLDVYPDGRAHNLTEGIARAKYRISYESPEPLEPGRVYPLAVELFPTSNHFAAGHRVRIEVSSSDFPNFARNLNTMNSDTGTETRIAHTKIHHSREYPSHILLPIIPTGATERWTPPRR